MREKIKSRKELSEICGKLKRENRKIGFTSGVFDLLHAGHVDYLVKAKDICDVLVVGVNSDASVRRFKEKNRPVIPEVERAKVIAGLEAVDYVFIFGERRNRKNIESLKPDYYIKAGNYSKKELTSAKVIEKFGGEVKLIEPVYKVSSSGIIEKIIKKSDFSGYSNRETVEKDKTVCFRDEPPEISKAVFLDRDGTINEEIEYLHEVENFKLLPNAVEGVKEMQRAGYKIVIITNQPGIGLGYFEKEDFYRVNKRMLREFSSAGISVSKIYFCPHSKSENCMCRKPGTALIIRACRDLNLDISMSYFIGDKTSDIEAGKRAGAKTILVKTGSGGDDKRFDIKPDYTAEDLLDAASYIKTVLSCMS